MAISFNNTSKGTNTQLSECLKDLLFASGGSGKLVEIINSINTADLEGLGLSNITRGTDFIASNLQKFQDGLPLSDVLPSSQLRPPINITKTATDIVADLQNRCTDFFLAALDRISPIDRLEQLLDLVNDLCGQLNFSSLRKVIDKIEQTQRDIIRESLDKLTTPLQKAAQLNDMLVDAINSGSQDAINRINDAIDELKYNQLYDYVNSLDPLEAIGRLQAEIKKRTQLGNIQGIQELMGAINSIEATIKSSLDNITSPIQDIFDTPENILNAAQNKIDDALNLGNYEEIQNIITAFDNVQNEVLSTLQNLDPKTMLQKGLTLLNDALKEANIAKYNTILDEMARKLCSESQLGTIPELPNIPNIQLPWILT